MCRIITIMYTDIGDPNDLVKISKAIEPFSQSVIDWSIDLTDCDKVLRIISRTDQSVLIKKNINHMGFNCEIIMVFTNHQEPKQS